MLVIFWDFTLQYPAKVQKFQLKDLRGLECTEGNVRMLFLDARKTEFYYSYVIQVL